MSAVSQRYRRTIFSTINQSSRYFRLLHILNLPSNLSFLISIISLGKGQIPLRYLIRIWFEPDSVMEFGFNIMLRLDLQLFIMSVLDVLKSLIKNLVAAKSIDLMTDFSNAKHSSLYSDIGMHLLFTSSRITSSDACLPTLPNTALDDR